ncbi:hypothetical protein LCGC14_1818020, partial [marine sediment metagenome]
HYKLSVELKVVIPEDDEWRSGIWHWIKNHPTNSDPPLKE